MNKKATIITYGCMMNVNDSAKIKKELINSGYSIINDIYQSDLVILNTCTIRAGAAEKVYGKLGELKNIKKKKEKFIIAVLGCLAQEEKQDMIKKTPFVDIIMGNQNIHLLREAIHNIETEKVAHLIITENEDNLPPRIDADFDSNMSASISITYGCNNFCTYCIVPYVRGRERSVPLDDIISEATLYINKGFKEIILLGQNVNSYGKDLDNVSFARLLKGICKIDGDFWIRFISPHPRDFTDELIEVIAQEDKICKHINLPLQAGSSKILKAMNRGYNKETYLQLVEKLKSNISGLALTTDIIVGFPGESEDDFNDTLDVIEKVEYDNAYMFMYSKRKGTPAADMDAQVSKEEKNKRLQILINKQAELSKKKSEEYANKKIKVLIEGKSIKNPNNLTGRTETNKVVIIKNENNINGEFREVEIIECKTWTLYGKLI